MRRAYQFKDKIDNIFGITKEINDDEIKAALVKYLCILISGYIELNIKEIIMEYTENKSSPKIQNYIEYSIQNMTNLNLSKIVISLNHFNTEWGNALENIVNSEQKDAINAIIANRNNIAHGKDVGISYMRIKNYYDKTKQVIDIIEQIVK